MPELDAAVERGTEEQLREVQGADDAARAGRRCAHSRHRSEVLVLEELIDALFATQSREALTELNVLVQYLLNEES